VFYQIDEVSHSQIMEFDYTYVLVRAWDTEAQFDAGEPPKRTNDFLMQLKLDHHGVPRDISRQIHDHIFAWRAAASPWSR
jgi:hypothetical protein